MNGEVILETKDGDRQRVTIGSSVKLYRMPSRQNRTVVDVGDNIITTNIWDIGVSRKTNENGDYSYIELFKEDGQIYIRDTGSTNETWIQDGLGEETLENGEQYPIQSDCTVYIGTNSESSVQVEIADSAASDQSATWSQISRQIMNVRAWLDNGSVGRVHEQAQILLDDIQALQDNETAYDELDEYADELEVFLKQLKARRDFESHRDSPTEETIEHGYEILSRLRGFVDRK